MPNIAPSFMPSFATVAATAATGLSLAQTALAKSVSGVTNRDAGDDMGIENSHRLDLLEKDNKALHAQIDDLQGKFVAVASTVGAMATVLALGVAYRNWDTIKEKAGAPLAWIRSALSSSASTSEPGPTSSL